MKKNILFISLTLVCSAYIHAQDIDSSKLIKYTPDFRFTDGVFLDFEQVKNNKPVKKAQLLTTVDYNDNTFFEEVLNKETLSFYDNFGQKFDFPSKSIWGYSQNGVLFKKVDNNYFRITIVGAICHFVAYITTYDYSPSYYSPYDRYNYYDYRYGNRNEQTNLKQYIIDFSTGKILEYTVPNLEALFVKDQELYDEYAELRKKKKNKLKFVYLRKFNERNPIYFPKNKIIP